MLCTRVQVVTSTMVCAYHFFEHVVFMSYLLLFCDNIKLSNSLVHTFKYSVPVSHFPCVLATPSPFHILYHTVQQNSVYTSHFPLFLVHMPFHNLCTRHTFQNFMYTSHFPEFCVLNPLTPTACTHHTIHSPLYTTHLSHLCVCIISLTAVSASHIP